MTLDDVTVFSTVHDDGSAIFTIAVGEDDDHKFSVAPEPESSNAVLSYEETQSWRAVIRVSEPRNEVFKRLMQSDEMTDYLESQDLTGVRRERHD